MLESFCYSDNTFVTLTYNDENLVHTDGDQATLAPEDATKFLKRFRKAIEPIKIRYFLVGEYGDENNRPHYHLAIFNFPRCYKGRPSYDRKNNLKPCSQSCVCEIVHKAWGKGRVTLDGLENASAGYIAGYTVKKMTAKDDMRLNGRHPEYARMSLRPGIGYNFMYEVASGLLEHDYHKKYVDVPGELLHGGKPKPIGRYLHGKLREMVGKDGKTPEEVLQQMEKEMQTLREDAFNNSRSFAQEIANAGEAKRKRLEAREKMYRRKKTL